jgi:hypothetical protein
MNLVKLLHPVAFFLVVGTAMSCARSKAADYSTTGDTEIIVEAPNTPQQPQENELIAGAMTGPMTEDDAIGFVQKYQEQLDACYEQEALSAEMVATAYVFELIIPPSGADHKPKLRHRTDPTKFALEHCVTEVFDTIDLPGHRGEEPLRVMVRVQGTMPVSAGAPVAEITADRDYQSSQTVR